MERTAVDTNVVLAAEGTTLAALATAAAWELSAGLPLADVFGGSTYGPFSSE